MQLTLRIQVLLVEVIRLTSWYGKYPIICRVLFYTSQVVQDFFHQQYVLRLLESSILF